MKKHYGTMLCNYQRKKNMFYSICVVMLIVGALYALIIRRTNQQVFFTLHELLFSNRAYEVGKSFFWAGFIAYVKQLLLIWIFSFFSITRPLAYGTLFLLIFSYGFTVASFILLYGVKGILIGFIMFGIQASLLMLTGITLIYYSKWNKNGKANKYEILWIGFVIVFICSIVVASLDMGTYSIVREIISSQFIE